MDSLKELKRVVCDCNIELYRKSLVVYSFGNVSGIDRSKGVIVIKPSGVPYESLRPEMMVAVDLDNKVVEGDYRPSSDTRAHTLLYRSFPKIGGVAHTHSTYACAWAQAMKPIPCLGTTHADHLTSAIPITEVMSDEQVARDYEEETGAQIVARFKDISYEEIQMALVACHAPFTWGESPWKAVYNAVILEELAKMAALTLSINPNTPELKKALLNKHYYRKHGANAYYGQK